MVVEAPAWGLLAIGLVFSFAFLWAFDKTWRATLGPTFRRLAGIGFGGVHGIGAVHPLGFLRDVDTHIEAWTADGLRSSERGIVYSLNRLIDTAGLLIGVPLAIALVLLELTRYVARQAARGVTRVEVHTIVKPVKTIVKSTTTVTRAQVARIDARVHALEQRVTHLARVGAGAIAAPFPRIGRLEHDLSNVKARLKKAEKTLAVGASLALVVAALRRLGLSWIRCNKVGKAGKAVCGMNEGLLESLLADALLVTSTLSIVELAKACGGFITDAEGGIKALIRELE